MEGRLDVISAAVNRYEHLTSNIFYAYHLGHKTQGIGNHSDAGLKHKERFLPADPFIAFQNFRNGFCVIVERRRLCPSHLRRNITENTSADIYVFNRFRKEFFRDLTKCFSNDLKAPDVSIGSRSVAM